MTNQAHDQIVKVVDVENLPNHCINVKLNNGTEVQFSEDDFQSIFPKSHAKMAYDAVNNIREAMKVRDDGTIRFSRIKQSSNFIENGLIKFERFDEGEASLNELKKEFPKLHYAISILHYNPILKVQYGVLKEFREFLLSFVDINEYGIFVSIDEKLPIQDFSRECCVYVLGESNEINVPDFARNGDIRLQKLTEDLVDSTTNLSTSIAGAG